MESKIGLGVNIVFYFCFFCVVYRPVQVSNVPTLEIHSKRSMIQTAAHSKLGNDVVAVGCWGCATGLDH